LALEALEVAGQGAARLVAQLALLLGIAEPPAAPPRVEQAEQLGQSLPAPRGVEALQHLVDEDPEALMDRRLGRDPEDPRELVAQRAHAVGLDVARGEHEALTAPGQERLQRRLVARGDRRRAAPLAALGVEHVLVERAGLEDLALLGGHRSEEHTSELQSPYDLVCRLLLEKKKHVPKFLPT